MMLSREATGFAGLRAPGVAVKICGITSPSHARLAASYGADLIGLVFAKSRRQVTVEQAAEIRQAIDGMPRRPLVVGVFVNEAPGTMNDISRLVGLDVVQLSGDETPEQVAGCAVDHPTIKALRFPAGTSEEDARALCDSYAGGAVGDRLLLLVDSYRTGEYGGTGQVSDWDLAAGLSSHYGIMLAGGLRPGNVGEAIQAVLPYAVDVSSGVETNGVKDPGLMSDFIRAARM